VLANDGTWVNLPNNASVSIRNGVPQPLFYEGIFDGSHYNPTANVTSPYQDAQNWFHYIFNPTDNTDGPTPQGVPLQTETIQSIQNWMQNPF
jgi:hypothetical protein